MFKSSIVAVSLMASSSAAAITAQDSASQAAVNALANKSHKQMKVFTKTIEQHHLSATARTTLKTKLSAKSLSVQSVGTSTRMVSKSSRKLRGKGKGKGDSKKSDSDSEEVDGEEKASPTQFVQIEFGVCAGEDFGLGPTTEDFFFDRSGFAMDVCYDAIGSDGQALSWKGTVQAEPAFAIAEHFYERHGCQGESVLTEDLTDAFTYGGLLSYGVGCQDGMKLSVTTEPNIYTGTPIILSLEATSSAACWSDLEAQEYSKFASFEATETGTSFFGPWEASCGEEVDEDDEPTGVYEKLDSSQCSGSPAQMTINKYSDEFCTTLISTETQDAKYCFFDVENFYSDITEPDSDSSDLYYQVTTCMDAIPT